MYMSSCAFWPHDKIIPQKNNLKNAHYLKLIIKKAKFKLIENIKVPKYAKCYNLYHMHRILNIFFIIWEDYKLIEVYLMFYNFCMWWYM